MLTCYTMYQHKCGILPNHVVLLIKRNKTKLRWYDLFQKKKAPTLFSFQHQRCSRWNDIWKKSEILLCVLRNVRSARIHQTISDDVMTSETSSSGFSSVHAVTFYPPVFVHGIVGCIWRALGVLQRTSLIFWGRCCQTPVTKKKKKNQED